MSYIAYCPYGLEELMIKETKGEKAAPKRVEFSKIKELKTPQTIYKLITKFDFKTKKDILNKVKSLNPDFIKKDFVVRCKREGKHDFNSNEIERNAGEIIYEQGYKVNLKSKTIIYIDIIDKKCFIGLLIKQDNYKRDYKIRTSPQGITPGLANCLLEFANPKPKDRILDQFCTDGTLLIEASLRGLKNLHGIDNANNIRNAEINSKLAKTRINLTQTWPKTKIDRIITKLPDNTQRRSLEPRLKTLFKQDLKADLDLITKDKELTLKHAKKQGFKLKKELGFNWGENKAYMLKFRKNRP